MKLITGRIYKPERLLYYIEPSKEQIDDFYKGIIPDVLMEYDEVFGTYDCPGLFRIKTEEGSMEVMGIEFRPNDDRIDYPVKLDSIVLNPGFMVSAVLTDVEFLDGDTIDKCVESVKKELADCNIRKFLVPKAEPNVVQIFTVHNSNRFYIEAEEVSEEVFFEDLTPSNDKEEKLFCTAYHDPITGHYNWSYIWPIIAGYGLKGIQDFCFAHFDVKDFNALNVVYGHDTANRVLRKIVDHMKEMDWIYYSARCDNDNFVMMIKDMPEEILKDKLLKFFNEISILDEDPNYHIFYRCGVVPMRNTILLGDRVADAGKQVQRSGNKFYETEVLFYTDSMYDDLDWATRIKAYLDTAIEQDEFLVYLQPKYDIVTEKIKGAEALIRWKYHGRELIPPYRFIPVFETGGLINKIDDIVLHKVCRSLKKWKDEGRNLYPISVNLSRKRMRNPDLIHHLVTIVDKYGIDHSLIDFELTESAAYDNQKYLIKVIRDLKDAGFKISMDDFGTGYSSLALLTEMPMDTIKIDKSFVDGIGSNKDNIKEKIVIKHIISMAKELNFTCLAEGAEEKGQIDELREFGCEIIQGYYYSKPVPIEEYEKLI